MIIPINFHVLIRPIKQEGIFAGNVYDEKGEVLSVPGKIPDIKPGEIVYFDSWLAAKYTDKDDKEFWLIPFENIRAVEKADWVEVFKENG